MSQTFPKLFRVRQNFPPLPPLDLRATVAAEFATIRPRLKPGARIAVAVGSRGITNLQTIVAAVLEQVRSAGARPFLLPAMGSHGGATPEGQAEVLATYGVTEASMGAPVQASMEVRQVGTSAHGAPAWCSVEALHADGVILVNRVKPHTDFKGTLGSGILKMCVIGLGKRAGAAAMHSAASRIGHEQAIRGIGRVLLDAAPILCGVAILENQCHDTARITVLPRDEIESREPALLEEARRLMPRLPFEEIDLLIVDRLGKNISGAGMDPNITGRGIHGYSSALLRDGRPAPFIRRIFVRDLTPETHGNATGIGNADVTTTRLVRAMDLRSTAINALTALSPQGAKIPMHFDTDREALELTLGALALENPLDARVVRIADTLSLADMHVSESLRDEVRRQPGLLTPMGDSVDMAFDNAHNLF